MKLISNTPVTQTVVTGTKSDGSDRQVVQVTSYVLVVLDDDGIQRTLTFDHNPAASEVYAAVQAAQFLTPTTKADWAKAIQADYQQWQMWNNMLAEATRRGVPQAYITAITNYVNTLWTTLQNDVLAWNAAGGSSSASSASVSSSG